MLQRTNGRRGRARVKHRPVLSASPARHTPGPKACRSWPLLTVRFCRWPERGGDRPTAPTTRRIKTLHPRRVPGRRAAAGRGIQSAAQQVAPAQLASSWAGKSIVVMGRACVDRSGGGSRLKVMAGQGPDQTHQSRPRSICANWCGSSTSQMPSTFKVGHLPALARLLLR